MAGLTGFEAGAEGVRCCADASAAGWLGAGDDDCCFGGTAVVADDDDVLMRGRNGADLESAAMVFRCVCGRGCISCVFRLVTISRLFENFLRRGRFSWLRECGYHRQRWRLLLVREEMQGTKTETIGRCKNKRSIE